METIVKQSILISRFQLTGYFRYHDYFQLLPYTVKETEYQDQHSVVLLQLVESVERLRAQASPVKRDTPLALQIFSIEEKTVINLLKFFLREDICGYTNSQKKWFYYFDGKENVNHWGKEGYSGEFPRNVEALSDISAMQPCAVSDSNKYYNRKYHTGTELTLPDNLSGLFDCYYSLPDSSQEVFLKAIYLFNQSMDLWDTYPSAAFVCMTSAVEALIPQLPQKEIEKSKCSECGTAQYSPTRNFRKFLKQYGDKSKVFDKFRERIYSIRSNFVHAGEVLEHEIFGSEESGFPYEVEHFRSAARNFIKISIINWLVEHHSNTPSS